MDVSAPRRRDRARDPARGIPASELSALRLDGDLFPIGDSYAPFDTLVGPPERARSLTPPRADRWIAELGTAAWIWGASATEPRPPEFCVIATERTGGSGPSAVREVILEPEDVVDLAGVRLTTPLRTAVELARVREEFGASELRVVRELAALGDFRLEHAIAVIERRPNLHRKRRALQRLGAALG